MTPPKQLSAQPPTGIRWLAHVALSMLLAAVWLLLRQSLALVDLIWAAVLGLVVPRLVFGFIGPAAHPRPQSLPRILYFVGVVLWDIVVSNLTVARIVLTPGSNPQPAWVPVPLDTRHPTSATLVAAVITMTPGTVSCVLDDERWMIWVHALDCDDPAALAAQIKRRYECPLMEIFG
jgi:multicomponent K+:H+ antiporter subunit E